MRNVIVLTDGESFEVWGSLKRLCDHHSQFSYNYLKKLKFPISSKGWKLIKKELRT